MEENNAIDITKDITLDNMPNVDVSRETVEQDAPIQSNENNASNVGDINAGEVESPDISGNEEQKPDDIDTMSYNQLRKLAKEKNITFERNIGKEELINLIKNADKPELDVKITPVLTLDNKPISPIVLSNDKEEIPKGFVAIKTIPKKNGMGFYNGRAYKPTSNGYAIWCDNGQSFELNSLK